MREEIYDKYGIFKIIIDGEVIFDKDLYKQQGGIK